MTVSVAMTPEEHYALTALLRSAVSAGTLSVLGLRDLLDRLILPYRGEMKSRCPETIGTSLAGSLPGVYLTGFPIHVSQQSWESLFEGRTPLEWYRWYVPTGCEFHGTDSSACYQYSGGPCCQPVKGEEVAGGGTPGGVTPETIGVKAGAA